jgi:hypothetical protein
VGLCVISALTPILVVQLLNLGDLGAKAFNLFTKRCELIHAIKNNIWQEQVWVVQSRALLELRSGHLGQ